MLGRVVTNFSRKVLDKEFRYSKGECYSQEIKSLYDLVCLGELYGDYLVFTSKYGRRELAYVHDIRFDYVHGRIFCPVFTYEYRELEEEDKKNFKRSKLYKKTDTFEIMYNQKLEYFDIWNSKEGYLLGSLTVLRKGLFGVLAYDVPISKLELRHEVQEESISALFSKYIKSTVFNGDMLNFDYFSSKYTFLSKAEKSLLSKYELMWYSDSEWDTTLAYRDVRSHTLLDLTGKFTDEELGLDKSFYSRIVDFESYLLSHLAKKTYWTDVSFENLVSKRWFFLKYKERGISLVLKSAWLDSY